MITMNRRGIGEREAVRILTRNFDSKSRLPLGFDDDVAAFPISPRNWAVLKTDTLVGSTDVPPGMSLSQAARKAVVATTSDFAAKGVRPRALLVSLGLKAPVESSTVKQIAKGLSRGAREYGCRIIGGDTGQCEDLVIDCIGFGLAEQGKIIRRDGARPGDIVAVTGRFGKTAAGLRILLSGRKELARRFPDLVNSVLYPKAKLDVGIQLARTGSVNSSIDSSDGLAWSLHEIARASRVSIHLEQIPLAPVAERFARSQELSAPDLALYGGEEYEIILSIDPMKFAQVKRKIPSLLRIGQVKTGSTKVTASVAGKLLNVEPRGWEHFKPA